MHWIAYLYNLERYFICFSDEETETQGGHGQNASKV